MKVFKIPAMEIIHFGRENVVSTSCGCVDCGECLEGKDNCHCDDFGGDTAIPG